MHANICYHIILTPKYRLPLFAQESHRASLELFLRHITGLRHIVIRSLAIMPDHVHLMINLPTGLSLGKAMQDTKWFTSLYMRKRYPELKQHRALWGKRYWARTVGGDATRVKNYIAQNIPEEKHA